MKEVEFKLPIGFQNLYDIIGGEKRLRFKIFECKHTQRVVYQEDVGAFVDTRYGPLPPLALFLRFETWSGREVLIAWFDYAQM